MPASCRNGKRRIAPSRAAGSAPRPEGASSSRAPRARRPPSARRGRPRSRRRASRPPRSAVDEVVRVAEAGHLARQLVALPPRRARCAGGRPGSTGENAPTIAATWGAQIPHALTTHSVSIRPLPRSRPRAPPGPARARSGHARPRPDVARRARAAAAPARASPCAGRRRRRPGSRPRRRGTPRRRGHEPHDLLRPDDLDVEPDRARPARPALELLEALRARRDPEAPDRLEDAELAVELHAVAAEAHHRRRRVELGDEPGRVAGRAARQLALLEEEDVRPAGLGEVIGDARPGDPAADDNHPRPLHAIETYATWKAAAPRSTKSSSSSPSSRRARRRRARRRADQHELQGRDRRRRAYVVRVSAKDAGLLAIDRENEHDNTVAAADAGVGARVIAYLPERGALVLEFIEGRTQTAEDLRRGDRLDWVAAACRRLHGARRFRDDFDMFRDPAPLPRPRPGARLPASRRATSSTSRRCGGSRRPWRSATRAPSRATTTSSPRTSSTSATGSG